MLPNYFDEIGKIPLLTAEEEVELSRHLQAGCEAARLRMIAANLRLVVKIAGEFANLGLPAGDLISEGNIGLIKAVERYRPGRGGRFATYAAWWIRESIRRALGDQAHIVRLTPVATSKLAKMRRVAHGLSRELGREPTDEELADELGADPAAVARLRGVAARPSSMDALISPDAGETFGSLLADHGAEDPSAAADGKDFGFEAGRLLSVLKPAERNVIIRRFGLDGRPPATLEEIAAGMDRTRERVRQLQEQALKRLRRAWSRRQALTFVPSTTRPA
jgi:RNA polymerase primary sigma factor